MKFQIKASSRKMRFLSRLAQVLTLLILCGIFTSCSQTDRKPAVPPEKVTIAYAATTDAVLAVIAQVKGYYQQEGLAVTQHPHPYGKLALKEVLEGKADFATVAETPVMFAIMKGEKISVIATIQSSSADHAILARRDKGIHTLDNLKGKRIAATLGTTSEFYLDTILAINDISRKDIQVADLKAGEMATALSRGEIDAASMFSPYSNIAQKQLGNTIITFQDKDIYRYTFNVVAKQDFIQNNPDKVRKVLTALVRSEEFVRSHPSEAQKIVADFTGIDIGIVRDIWAETSFTATLDQSLILALEDESIWAINGGLTYEKKVPNYLDFIYLDGLAAVKPGAVRILR